MIALTMPTVVVKAGHAKRALAGHPWVFSNEIEMTAEAKALRPGGVVALAGGRGEDLGTAMFNPHSLIAARRLCRSGRVAPDRAWFAEGLARADRLRRRFFEQPYYRLAHAEADGLPGLIVDRFDDVFVVQANIAGMDRLLPDIALALAEVFAARAVLAKNDSQSRALEGLAPTVSWLAGQHDGPLALLENGHTYFCDPTGGQKTGWFYDHRENRAFVAALAHGRRVLDLYSYCGGFAIACAAAGAAAVTAVDRSAAALALAERAAEANGVGHTVATQKSDAFACLEYLERTSDRFDIVIADPPAFVKTRKDLGAGAKGYGKLARLAARVVAPGGILAIASCSHHMPLDQFIAHVAKGIDDAKRSAALLRVAFAGPDHPIHPRLPESGYLKFLAFALD